MPDWSYHPVFRPLLFRLPPRAARDLTFGAMGTLARLPWGTKVIESMGHMSPPQPLERTAWGRTFATPLGLAAGLDVKTAGLPALAKFGFGFLEVGPVTVEPVGASGPIERRVEREEIYYPDPLENEGMDALTRKLARMRRVDAPLAFRLGHRPGSRPEEAAEERRHLIANLAGSAAFFVLETAGLWDGWTEEEWQEHVAAVMEAARGRYVQRPVLLGVAADEPPERVERRLAIALAAGMAGVVVSDALREGEGAGRVVGRAGHRPSVELVAWLRAAHPDLKIIASGGVHEPEDALKLLEAGADFVQIHSGLVFSGPGLPKRTNEAILFAQTGQAEPSEPSESVDRSRAEAPPRPFFPAWVWVFLLGIGMVIGGALAWYVAVTRVVLPYDEAFLGMTRAEIDAVNPDLLHFMSHDRISLAGTMISIGIIYLQLAYHALRKGVHWALIVMRVSGIVGFGSFLLFLGYGYFDQLHAVLSGLLLPLFIIGVWRLAPTAKREVRPNLRNDRAWRLANWGQLIFVAIGGALTTAGIVISLIGVTYVFVPEDLAFMATTPAALEAANPRLIPLIAHDRAGFGGALASDGLAVLLIALWGFRQGERWLWWTLLVGGTPGFLAGIGIHFAVGYTDWWHLLPAYAAAALFAVGLALSYPYLCTGKKVEVS